MHFYCSCGSIKRFGYQFSVAKAHDLAILCFLSGDVPDELKG